MESELRFEFEICIPAKDGRAKNSLRAISISAIESYVDEKRCFQKVGRVSIEVAVAKGHRGFNLLNIVVRPKLTFFYNYVVRLGFLDGREGLLLHLYHAVYVSWKYAKAWELANQGR